MASITIASSPVSKLPLESDMMKVLDLVRAKGLAKFVMFVRSSSVMRNHEISAGWMASLLQDARSTWFTGVFDKFEGQIGFLKTLSYYYNPDREPIWQAPLWTVTYLTNVTASTFELVTEMYRLGWPEDDPLWPSTATPMEPLIISRSLAVLVNTSTRKRGHTLPWMHEMAAEAAAHESKSPFMVLGRQAITKVDDAVRDTPRTLTDEDKQTMYLYEAQLRYSDEDSNLHINQAAYLRMFTDAVVTFAALHEAGDPKALAAPARLAELAHDDVTGAAIDYMRETHARSRKVDIYIGLPKDGTSAIVCKLVLEGRVHAQGRLIIGPLDFMDTPSRL